MSDAAVAYDVATAEGPTLCSAEDQLINRELSWLAFNYRVLEEAFNPVHPPLERLKFLSISGSNLDEFYMVRVAGLHGQVREKVAQLSDDGRSPEEQLEAIHSLAARVMAGQAQCWKTLSRELRQFGISVVDNDELLSERSPLVGGVLSTADFSRSDAVGD